jgi:hypothetical protein
MWSINPFTNPNPVYGHTYYVTTGIRSGVRVFEKRVLRTTYLEGGSNRRLEIVHNFYSLPALLR